jgi:hypothetical protein
MDELTSTTGIVALAAVAVALVSLALAIVLAVKLHRVRSAQSAVLGESGTQDLVEHAARIERAFSELRDFVEDALAGSERRMAEAEARLDGCLTYRAVIRYDAYGEMSGRQSSSFALLDAHRSGVVVSSIHHRDQARVYVKQVHEGRSEYELSPEEEQAIETALSAPPVKLDD